MEDFFGALDSFIDVAYVLTVVFGAEAMFRITTSKTNAKYKVFLMASILFVAFYYFHYQELGQHDNAYIKKLVLSYTFSTSMYELVIKELKRRLKKDETNTEAVENRPTGQEPEPDHV